MEHAARRKFMTRFAGMAGLVGLGSSMALTSTTVGAQGVSTSQLTAPIQATINGVATTLGRLTINNFSARGNQIVANGIATLTDANNVTRVFRVTNLPVQITQATCDILDLTLGPLDLNLLGLQIHLDRVVLIITADPSGGLLGQLLCGIANLLSGGGPLQQIVGLLNQLVALLR